MTKNKQFFKKIKHINIRQERKVLYMEKKLRPIVETYNTDEVWKYSKKKIFVPYLGKKRYVQSLKDIQAICKDCHAVKHIGYTKHNGNYKKAKKWFRKINNCDKETFNEAEHNAYIKYNKRSQYKWYLLIDNDKLYNIINKKGKSKI